MSVIKICNHCHKIFHDDSIKEYAHCPYCEGEIVNVNEDDKDNFLENSVWYGAPEGQRQLYLNCTFRTEREAEALIYDLDEKGWGIYLVAPGYRGVWSISGPIHLTLGEMHKAIDEINLLIEQNNPIEFFDWISIRFQD